MPKTTETRNLEALQNMEGDFLSIMSEAISEPEMPDIVTFAEHSSFLGEHRRLYPRQKSLLRLWFLETEFMTAYDVDVISQWADGFYEGELRCGVAPDVWRRVEILKEQGFKHFPEIVNISGRRGGKGHLGAIMAAYQALRLIKMDDPQWYYSVERGKELYTYVTATGLSQAKAYQFADLANAVLDAPCFRPWISSGKPTFVTLRTPADNRRIAELKARGVQLEREMASIVLQPLSANSSAARGGAATTIIFDEMAHMLLGTDGPRTADSLYNALTPSLGQLGKDGLIYVPTSPYTKVGKSTAVSQLIATPDGYRKMGDIGVGATVLGRDGCPTRVTHVYPQGELSIYKVTLQDGRSVRVTGDHLWFVQDSQQRNGRTKHKLGEVRSTSEIRALLDAGETRKTYLPNVEPIQYSSKELLVPPYALGALLGDGCLRGSTPMLTYHDTRGEEVHERVLRELQGVWPGMSATVRSRRSGTSTAFYTGYSARVPGGTVNPLTDALRNLGLWGHGFYTKQIPPQYLCSSIQDRLDLLRGLLDTDGYLSRGTSNGGVPVFCTSSPQLRDDVRELVEGLGGVVSSIQTKPAQPDRPGVSRSVDAYSLRIRLPFDLGNPFYLSRKKEGWEVTRPYRSQEPVRRIVSVELDGQEEAQCITVEAEDHLFLLEHYIPTHNCYSLYEDGLEVAPGGDPAHPEIIVSQLPSWTIYEDFDKMVNRSKPFRTAPMVWDERAEDLKARSPYTFRVERESQWAEVMDSYLSPKMVDKMFEPVRMPDGLKTLEIRESGALKWIYRGHCDPSKSEANTAAAIGHLEPVVDEDGETWHHVFIDWMKVWKPGDQEDHQVDYIAVEKELTDRISLFPAMKKFSYDQYGSFVTVPRLKAELKKRESRTDVIEVPFDAKANARRCEIFKAALGLRWVHAPLDTFGVDDGCLLEHELKFLHEKNGRVDCQSIGPVTTKDLADCVMVITEDLIGKQLERFRMRDQLTQQVQVGAQGGYATTRDEPDRSDPSAARKKLAALSSSSMTGARWTGAQSR